MMDLQEKLKPGWRGRPHPGGMRGSSPDREKDRRVIEMLNNGMGVSEVAEEMGVTRQAIHARLLRIEREQGGEMSA